MTDVDSYAARSALATDSIVEFETVQTSMDIVVAVTYLDADEPMDWHDTNDTMPPGRRECVRMPASEHRRDAMIERVERHLASLRRGGVG